MRSPSHTWGDGEVPNRQILPAEPQLLHFLTDASGHRSVGGKEVVKLARVLSRHLRGGGTTLAVRLARAVAGGERGWEAGNWSAPQDQGTPDQGGVVPRAVR